jgi:hypothetical protein
MIRHKLVTNYLKTLTLSPSSAQATSPFNSAVSNLRRRVRVARIRDSRCSGSREAALGMTFCVLRGFLNVLKS